MSLPNDQLICPACDQSRYVAYFDADEQYEFYVCQRDGAIFFLDPETQEITMASDLDSL